ncbi:MAG: hypothetical protein ACOYM3_23185, partial [Terrimicrobiaceae bacterium]
MKATFVILACTALCGHALAAGPKAGTWDHPGTSIANGGFEDWDAEYAQIPGKEVKLGSDGAPLSWQVEGSSAGGGVSLMKDTLVKHSGLASARVEVAETGDGVFLDQLFSVEPSTSYLVRIWVRGKDIVPATGKAHGGILIWANSGPARGFFANQKSLAKKPARASGTFDWQLFEFPVETSSEAARLKIGLQMRTASGTAWFDDVEVVKSDTA